MRVRADNPQRFVDIAYSQLAAEPLTTVDGIAARLGAELTPAARQQITTRVRRAEAARPRAHRYHLDRYGLTPQHVRDAFSFPQNTGV